jgi:hypothetical protein
MTQVRHLEVTFIPKKSEPFTLNQFAFAATQPQLFIKFQVEKQVSSEPNSAFLEIYNLSEEHSAAIDFKYDPFAKIFGPQVIIKGGYLDEGIKQMYSGIIVEAATTFEAPHYITRVRCLNIYHELMRRPVTYQVAAGQLKADAILAIIQQAGGFVEAGEETVLRTELAGSKYDEDEIIEGTFESFITIIRKGYPRRIVVYWDDAGVSFSPLGKPAEGRPLKIVSESTGLIGVPQASSSGIEYETTLDPTYRINDSVQIISESIGRLALAASRTVLNATDPTSVSGIVFSGITVVSKVIHSGDNREGDFKTSVVSKQVLRQNSLI